MLNVQRRRRRIQASRGLHGWHNHDNLSLHSILFDICGKVSLSFFFFFRALLRARLIGGLGLWLFLCFSLHYSSHSFAFLQVHYHSMITRRSSIHGGSNVYKNMVRCLLLESQAQKTEIFMMGFFLCCFSSSFCASYFARWPVGLSSASVVSLLYWYGKTRHTYSSQIKACTFTVSPSPPNVYISRFSAHKTFIELFDSIVHDTFKHAF